MTRLDDMTKRVRLFYEWGKGCRERGVWPETAEYALFVDHPVARRDWLTETKAAENVYEIDAFWNGFQNGAVT